MVSGKDRKLSEIRTVQKHFKIGTQEHFLELNLHGILLPRQCAIWYFYSDNVLFGTSTQTVCYLVLLPRQCAIWYFYPDNVLFGTSTQTVCYLVLLPRQCAIWYFYPNNVLFGTSTQTVCYLNVFSRTADVRQVIHLFTALIFTKLIHVILIKNRKEHIIMYGKH